MSEQVASDERRRGWVLATLCLSLVLIVVGNTVLNVALPRLAVELPATNTQLQWMVDSYALVFAGLLLTCGALGDRFGRKGALQIGLVVFAVGSGLSVVAHSADQLIATRALMGLAAALVMPATLSILTTVYPPEQRARAIAIWAGLAGGGAAIGPIASGLLLEHFWWGSVFLINLPIVLLALVAGHFLVPKSRDAEKTPLDPVGALLSVLGLTALLYAIIEGPNEGWLDPRTIAVFLVALVLLLWFGLWELWAEHPMLDLRFFRNPRFSAASAAITLVFFAMFGSFFLFTQYLQLVLGYSPLEAGLRMLPMAVGLMVTAPSSARLVERFGTKRVVSAGLASVGLGMVLSSTLDANTSYPRLIGTLLVLSIGMGLTMAPCTASIMGAVPPGKAGVGSAVNDTTRELGGALGVAVLGSLLVSRYTDFLDGAPEPARKSLGQALAVAARTGGDTGAALAARAREAYLQGMGRSLVIAGVVAFVASAVVGHYLPAGPPVEIPQPGTPDATGELRRPLEPALAE